MHGARLFGEAGQLSAQSTLGLGIVVEVGLQELAEAQVGGQALGLLASAQLWQAQ